MRILKNTAGRIEDVTSMSACARRSGVHEVPVVDIEKIARLRAKIRDGLFEIDAEAIARKIVG